MALGHMEVPGEKKAEKPVVEIDYSFLRADGEHFLIDIAEADRATAEENSSRTVLSAVDDSTGLPICFCVPTKTAPKNFTKNTIG